MRALEPRILLDAASVETVADITHSVVHEGLAESYSADTSASVNPITKAIIVADSEADIQLATTAPEQRREIAFIAAGLENVDQLIASLDSNIQVVLIDSTSDGVSQIANALAGLEDIDAIHILTHGDAGALVLGNSVLTTGSMDSTHADNLASIGATLSDAGDILIYGCDFAAGEFGQAALAKLADLTGADIAASDDITGHADLGGDWDLERQTGEIETETLENAEWLGQLPDPWLVNNNAGNNSHTDVPISSGLAPSQEFTIDQPGDYYEITQFGIKLKLLDNNDDGQTVFIDIKDADTGAVIATFEADANQADDTSFDWVDFTIPNPIAVPTQTLLVFSVYTDAPDVEVVVGLSNDKPYAGHNYIPADGSPPDTVNDLSVHIRGVEVTDAPPEFFVGGVNADNPHTIFMDENTFGDSLISASGAFLENFYSIVGGPDAALFSTTSIFGLTGFNNAPDFENDLSAGGNNIYTIQLMAQSTVTNLYDLQTVNFVVQNVSDGEPYFDAAGQGSDATEFVTIDENTTAIGTFSATHTEAGATLTYSIQNGPDKDKFGIDTATGEVWLLQGADFEQPNDDGTNRVYSITLLVSDGMGGTDSQPIEITYQDVQEAPRGGDKSFFINEDEQLPILAVDLIFFDPEADPIKSIVIDDITFNGDGALHLGVGPAITNGTEIDIADVDQLVFIPAANKSGTFTFTYTVNDDFGDGTVKSTITINVAAINDTPVVFNGALSANEDQTTPINVTLPTDVEDPQNTLTIEIDNVPDVSQGTIHYTTDGGMLRVLADNDTLTVSELGTLTFTGATNHDGAVQSLRYSVTDSAGGASQATTTIALIPVNDAPAASSSNIFINEDIVGVISVPAIGDVDDNNNALNVTITQIPNPTTELKLFYPEPGIGNVELSVGDVLTYAQFNNLSIEAIQDFDGAPASLNFTVSDDDGASDAGSSGSVSFTMIPVNDFPDGYDDDITVVEDTATLLNATVPTDVDDAEAAVNVEFGQIPRASQGTVTFTSDTNGATVVLARNMVLSLTEFATLSFIPTENYTGNVRSLQYTAFDDSSGFNADAGSDGTINITITPVNDAPVAVNDANFFVEDGGGVLAPPAPIDVDDNLSALTIHISQIPDPIVQGVIFYDNGGPALVQLNVGDVLSYAEYQTITFDPTQDYDGPVDHLLFTVRDDDGAHDAGSDGFVAFTMIPVNDAPEANDDNVGASEEIATPLNISLPTDIDNDDATLTATINQIPTVAQGKISYTSDAGGTVELTVGETISYAELASLTFTSAQDYNGPVQQLTYTVEDTAGLTSNGSVAITITPVNDAPLANNDAVNADEETATPLNITLPTDVDDNDATLTATINQIPTTAQGSIFYTSDAGGVVELALDETLSAAELATLTFTSAQDYNGPVVPLTYTVEDAAGLTSNGSVTIVIMPINDAPVASDNAVNADEEAATPLNITLPTDSDDTDTTLTATINQIPPVVQGIVSYTADAGGTVQLTLGDTLSYAELATLTFTSAVDYDGLVQPLTYTVQDAAGLTSNGSVVITITPVNDAPVAQDDAVTVTEDTAHALNPSLPSDVDDADSSLLITLDQVPSAATQGALTYTSTSGATETATISTTLTAVEFASLTFTPIADFNGTVDLITYTVSDDDGATSQGSIAITMASVNDLLVAQPFAVDVPEATPTVISGTMLEGVDADGDEAISITFNNLNLNGGTLFAADGAVAITNGMTILSTDLGNLLYRPDMAVEGPASASFDYLTNDTENGTTPATVTLNITATNDAPVSSDSYVEVLEDESHTFAAGEFISTDNDDPAPTSITFGTLDLKGGTLTYANGAGAIMFGGTYSMSDLATLVYKPAANFNGTASFQFSANDAQDSGANFATMAIEVKPVNDAPTTNLSNISAPAGELIIIPVASFGFADVDGDTLREIIITNIFPNDGGLTYGGLPVIDSMPITISEFDDLIYTPVDAQAAQITFDLQASDGIDFGAAQSIQLTLVEPIVVEPPTPPVVTPPPPPAPDPAPPAPESVESPPEPEAEAPTPPTSAPSTPAPPTIAQLAPAETPVAVAQPQPQPFVEPEPEPEPEPKAEPKPVAEALDPNTKQQQPTYSFREVDRIAFNKDLDQTGEEVREGEEGVIVAVAKATFAFTSVISVGSVAWMLRGGALGAALLSALPAWNRFDPISIVTGKRDETEEEDIKDVDMMREHVLDARARVKEESFL